ncbi:HD domain-containing phosphohydrolase [Candidatus Ferrigenium straubiae]|jgi:PAS domain S-box-containing protein/putative nucleotidyltransferase with HDIG domain|uniref:HD domain-containing phosphohydrolase n=1 Tax=Candidatus Ferrigenium straubiae TaxID=2919506 RepID=UPI003F4AEE0B
MDIPAGQAQLRILLLEDQPTDAELAENALREADLSFVSRRVDTREAFVQALEEFKPDIILADYRLPAFDGASAVRIVQQQHPDIPVVMVTGAVGDENAIELLKLGARDYILKDRLARLGPAVKRTLSEERGIRARKAAEKALRESEVRFRTVFENAKDVILALSTDGTLIMLNPAFEQVTGWACAEWLGKSFSPLVHPNDLPNAMHLLQRAVRGEALPVFELRILKKTGDHVVGEFTITPLVHDGTNAYLLGIARDVTERKQAEARIRKLTRLYATLSQTNKTIVRSTNRDDLFRNICKAAVEHGKFVMAWVGLVDETTHMVKPVCHDGAEQGYLSDIAVSTGDLPEGSGPTGSTIRESRVGYINNFVTDERALPWREAALQRGFHSSAGLPLRFQGKVIGALTIYSDEPDFFDAEQLDLMEEMSADISFALDGFEREALRQQAEEGRGTALQKLKKSLEDSIRVAASISEVRDPYTAGHQQRVSQLAVAIAREMGLSATRTDGIRFGGLIHDIGKIGVPAEILSKPSILAPLEMKLIQTHPQAGYEVVKDIEFPWPVAQMILQHHERLDGSGYPAGLKGDGIIPEARIIAVADTVEAMSSHRPYRPGRGMDAALAEIISGSGTRYDAQAVEACLRLIREKGFTFDTD